MRTIEIGRVYFTCPDRRPINGQLRVLVHPEPSVSEDAAVPDARAFAFHQVYMPEYAWKAIEQLAELGAKAEEHAGHALAMWPSAEPGRDTAPDTIRYLLHAMRKLAQSVRVRG